MAENLKNLVHSINNVLNTEYNLISFDALNEEALLQILMDVFLKFNVISSKVSCCCNSLFPKITFNYIQYDVGENDPEDTNKLIMECLAKIQYTDESMDIGTLRRGLVQGDKKIIYPIFEWMFENQDLILKLAYLAKFLMPLNLTPEAISIPEVMTLYSQYEIIMEEFKQVHQGHEMAVQDGKKTQELRNDSNAIEIELENVKKRIERLQVRLDKVPQQELILDAAKNLRVEKDKQKELMSQLDEQKQAMQRVVTINERLQKEYNNIRNATQGTTPKQMLESIMEEAQVLEFMVKQKLPQELTLRQTEVQILEDVINEPNIGRDYLQDLQEKFDDISKEVQKLVEAKMNDKSQQNDALGLGPFRQQAMVIARNKEIAAEELDQLLKEMKEVDNQMKEKQQKMKDTVGEVVLRGDDLKQFVNTLKAKSNVYKQQRAELGAIKAEASDLQNTLENLRAQDPSLATVSSDDDPTSLEPMFSRSDSPVESRGMTELSHLVDSLTRAVVQAREKISPMSQQLRPLRERITELKDECDSKKQVGEKNIAFYAIFNIKSVK